MPTKAFCLFVSLFVSTAAAASDGHTQKPNTHIAPDDLIVESSAQWDSPPELVSGRLPIYPISQLLSRKPGTATVQYTIGMDGTPKDIQVEEASDRRFGDHAIIAVRQWKFRPALKNANPMDARVRETFTYDPYFKYGRVTASPLTAGVVLNSERAPPSAIKSASN